jgi:hypothetical protein
MPQPRRNGSAAGAVCAEPIVFRSLPVPPSAAELRACTMGGRPWPACGGAAAAIADALWRQGPPAVQQHLAGEQQQAPSAAVVEGTVQPAGGGAAAASSAACRTVLLVGAFPQAEQQRQRGLEDDEHNWRQVQATYRAVHVARVALTATRVTLLLLLHSLSTCICMRHATGE